ncbi:G-protein coupled receptor Mth-like 1-like 5 [Homarus americanus]|uniref:G-protein coupled receptor Mth-like 1-like 5 n=2 Tax=Homarus americanus TaxID=6706 RepID=A0A8J5NBN6_HOMAM|nr:G-protein coupled receptor Mth-like 1-like 5 [Homarus americanus]
MRQFGRWFICYNIYAWGCPVVVGLVAVLMDTLKPSGAALPYFVSPNCWFRDKASAWAYMYGIVLVLLMVNLCLFIHLAYRFKRMFNVQPSATRPRQFGLRLRVHLTLMVIMGLGWAGELRVTNFTSCNWR